MVQEDIFTQTYLIKMGFAKQAAIYVVGKKETRELISRNVDIFRRLILVLVCATDCLACFHTSLST